MTYLVTDRHGLRFSYAGYCLRPVSASFSRARKAL